LANLAQIRASIWHGPAEPQRHRLVRGLMARCRRQLLLPKNHQPVGRSSTPHFPTRRHTHPRRPHSPPLPPIGTYTTRP
jgi:hypothetical protein